MDANGNLYILERSGHGLRVVNKNGIIRTVAGTGKAGTTVGKALETQMNGPKHLCIDTDGSVLIADAENHRVLRYLPKEEKCVIVAGSGKKGANGLDGDPLQAELNRPHGVAVPPKTGELHVVNFLQQPHPENRALIAFQSLREQLRLSASYKLSAAKYKCNDTLIR